MPFSVVGVLPGYHKRDLKATVTQLVAAERGDEVVLYAHRSGLWEVRVNYGKEYAHQWQASFWFDYLSHRVNIQWMHRPDDAEPGWGRKKFLVLAARWQSARFKVVHASPADGPPNTGMTGYYFWPRVGFNGHLTKEHRKALPKQYRHVETIQQLFALPGGPEVWKQHGSQIYGLTLDLETL